MSGGKCRNCGCTEIDVDPARGDAVCTNCGSVLEDSIIVSEVQFEENAHGGSSALGQFVSADSKGGARGFGGSFHAGLGKESREITLNNARRAITNLAQQLRLNQHCIDTAFNFYKMALTRQLTRGRKNTYVIAACVYMTCRTEGTPHLLIDFSDVLQTCVYELGRTYLRLSQALCINIPAMDPCLYILRFANRLEFGDKTHEVSMTALRLVQRMKRDFIHSGRRPSGLCGAALLMAARLHEFNRTVNDIIKIVKVHESTVKKRLVEFGDTPSSALTLDEFMTVDLEEEQDPPSFKMARQKDKERLQKLINEDEYCNSFNELQREIYTALEAQAKTRKKSKKSVTPELETDQESQEKEETDRFIAQSTLGTIQEYVADDPNPAEGPSLQKDSPEELPRVTPPPQGLGPDIVSMRLATSMDDRPETDKASQPSEEDQGNGEIDLTGIDDDEIESYIMNEREAHTKDIIWMKMNEQYLKEQKEKQEKLEREKEEGKPEKKKRKTTTKKKTSTGGATSAGEAIEKMLQEKRISTKINYEVLKNLNVRTLEAAPSPLVKEPAVSKPSLVRARPSSNALKSSLDSRKTTDLLLETLRSSKKPTVKTAPKTDISPRKSRTSITEPGSPPAVTKLDAQEQEPSKEEVAEPASEPYADDEFEEEVEVEPDQGDHMSLAQMLNHHREDDDYYGDYDYDEY